jgi:hypothetical protein
MDCPFSHWNFDDARSSKPIDFPMYLKTVQATAYRCVSAKG